MSEPVIELTNVVVRRGAFTLDVPTWTVQPGRVVGLVGANGAGKTTLLRLLPGLDPVDGGQVRTLGLDPRKFPVEVRSRVGWMSDDLALYPFRVGELMRMLKPLYPTWDDALGATLLQRFKLEPGAWVDKLSKGEGTRVRLLLAMAFRPKLLVLDEPGTGLDLGNRHALLKSVLELAGGGTTVVVSSHQLDDVERIADHLTVVDRGRIVQDGPTPDLVGEGRTLEEAMVAWGVAG